MAAGPDYEDLESHAFFLAASGEPMIVTRDGRCSHWCVHINAPAAYRGYYVSWGAALGYALDLYHTHENPSWDDLIDVVTNIASVLSQHGQTNNTILRKINTLRAINEPRTRYGELMRVIAELPIQPAPSWRTLLHFGGNRTADQYARAFDEAHPANFVGARQVRVMCDGGDPFVAAHAEPDYDDLKEAMNH